jgi:diguanylate cyclase (GGDEF)-like protein
MSSDAPQGRSTSRQQRLARRGDPLARIVAGLSRWSVWTHVVLGIGAFTVIGLIDRVTGPETSLAVFQLIPLAMLAWFVSRPAAVALATAAGFAWYWDYSPMISSGAGALGVQVWACVSRVGFFMLVVWLVSALRELYDHQRELATTDELTGVANRRALLAAVDREVARGARAGVPISLVYIDADHFKAVNDRLGHAAGDRLLRAVAHTLETTVRRADVVARLGGDEFAVLLPETGPEAAAKVAGKLRNVLAVTARAHDWPVTFSIGVATFTGAPTSAEEMLRRADALQYAAKHGGRDMIVQASVAA